MDVAKLVGIEVVSKGDAKRVHCAIENREEEGKFEAEISVPVSAWVRPSACSLSVSPPPSSAASGCSGLGWAPFLLGQWRHVDDDGLSSGH